MLRFIDDAAARQRVTNVGKMLDDWRSRASYMVLANGGAFVFSAGYLHEAVQFMRDRPAAQLIELCDPRALEWLTAWALSASGGNN